MEILRNVFKSTEPKNPPIYFVGLNGTPESNYALDIACGMAKKSHAQLYGAYVIEVEKKYRITEFFPERESRGETILGAAQLRAHDNGVYVSSNHFLLLQAREAWEALADQGKDLTSVINGNAQWYDSKQDIVRATTIFIGERKESIIENASPTMSNTGLNLLREPKECHVFIARWPIARIETERIPLVKNQVIRLKRAESKV